jgi:hypothetical protein
LRGGGEGGEGGAPNLQPGLARIQAAGCGEQAQSKEQRSKPRARGSLVASHKRISGAGCAFFVYGVPSAFFS